MYAPKTRKRSNGDDLLALRRDLIPSVTGLSDVPVVEAEPVPPPSESGIASPLTEISRKVKTYNDGFHIYRVAVQSTFEDANGAEVVINYLPPTSPDIVVI
jgi:hypothetical protein